MKKFFLSVEDRDLIVEALLRVAQQVKAQIPMDMRATPEKVEEKEAAVQKNNHLAALFKVDEYER